MSSPLEFGMPVERRGDDSITSGVNREAWMVILNKKDPIGNGTYIQDFPKIRMKGNSCPWVGLPGQTATLYYYFLRMYFVLLFASPHAVSILDPASTSRWPPHSRHGDYGIKVPYLPT